MTDWAGFWLGGGFALGCLFLGIAAEAIAEYVTDKWFEDRSRQYD